ncbi:hypothetical protein AX15_004359 [Amanita polypyramis BW_CC]|nr:hypothetical protein AX15_004359 [Amanita polypyramis BW_CC]
MTLSIVAVIRLALLAVVTLFSIVVLGLAAHSINVTAAAIGSYFTFDALGVATAVLSIVTLLALIILSLLRKGALPNYILVESAWFSLLWVLWLATAADTANATIFVSAGCNYKFEVLGKTIDCQEFPALQAFAWLNWIFLMGYVALTVVLAIIQQTRGNSVWFKSVNEVDLFAPPAARQAPMMESGMMPPQQQQMYSSQQHVPQQMPPQQMSYAPSTDYGTPQQGYTSPPQQGYSTPYQVQGQAPMNTGNYQV